MSGGTNVSVGTGTSEAARRPADSLSISAFDGPDLDLLIRQGFCPAPIAAVAKIAPGILSVTLTVPCGRSAAFTPGAHLEVAIPLPGGPAIRHYSLCSPPDGSAGWQIAVLDEPTGRGGSRWLHEHLTDCRSLLIRGPRNTFGYQRRTPMLFVAGGIGITPISAMIHDAEDAGVDWHLIYIGRRAKLMAFAAELEAAHGSSRVDLHLTEQTGRPDIAALARDWLAAAGVSGSAPTAPEAEGALEGPVVYTCGPVPLMRALAAGLQNTDAEVVAEDFEAQSPVTAASTARGQSEVSGQATVGEAAGAATASGTDAAFTVETSDGSEVEVGSGESILTALGAAGVRTLSSCQKGTCGTCETAILAGRAEHRDHVLSAEEREAQQTMMICVSRAETERIVLDI